MNRVCIVGRLTRDPDVKYGQGENSAVARFSLAVDRRFKNKDGQYEADFPSFVAFGKTAEFVEKYFKKGMKMGVVGRIQTGKYTNADGQTVYTTDIVAEEIEFVESKGSHADDQPANDGFVNVPEGTDAELPFN